jgi:bacillolysin
MPIRRRVAMAACVAATCVAVLCAGRQPAAQARTHLQTITAGTAQALRQWDGLTAAMLRSGELRVRDAHDDTLVAGRVVERDDQYYRGVRVFGADIARQIDGSGVVQSIFGNIYSDITIATEPDLDEEAVRARVAGLAGQPQADGVHPELVVLPSDDGSRFSLAWRMRAVTPSIDIIQYFLDAKTGGVLLQYSDRQSQAAVGRAVGVLGDSKKISVSGTPGSYLARDLLRPPLIQTDDMKGDPNRTTQVLNGTISPGESDIASRSDLNWTDGAVDDAQVYAGYTYDYYYKRFGRRGLDDNNIQILGLVNPVHRTRDDLLAYFTLYPDFFANAFYAGGGMVVYGVGLPAGSVLRGQTWNFTSGALDLVGHELSHGVTEFTSNLIYRDESGALNEAFSDMMGTSIEFFFQPAGTGGLKADYLLGEDVVQPGGRRSMENPGAFGDPDHYSIRFVGTADNGGVHTNSGIANQAFYLAIEGGTNRTSGLPVQGVGAGNREQIEKVFYRAFTQLMPSNSTFATARAATIQAARDLYGTNSAAERAVTQAWTAVGVN